MDPRRFVILALAGASLGGCVQLPTPPTAASPVALAAARAPVAQASVAAAAPPPARTFATMSPIPNPAPTARPAPPATRRALPSSSSSTGRDAIAAANLEARTPSRAQAFLGGLQVFDYEPGRVYEVWTAPLRVTTLTLAPGEKVTAKAAGDTVRWQIGETVSGEGETQRAHVMIKPLMLGLETNLALTTSRRLYLLHLRSGPPAVFNAAVAWDVAAALPSVHEEVAIDASAEPPPLAAPGAPLDARFAIRPKGRRPAWTPSAVMTDGVRTYLSFPPQATATETPALFALDASGQPQMVNYRQQAGLWVVDRVLDRAELRLGGRRPQIVRIERLAAAS